MMENNAYDDLFKDTTKPAETSSTDDHAPDRDPKRNQNNLKLLFVYLGVMLFIILISQMLFGVIYPDLQSQTENIRVTENFTYDVGEYDDVMMGYPVTVEGEVINDNPDIVPTIQVDVTLIAGDGTTITSFSLQEYEIGSGENASFSETLTVDERPADMEASLYVDAHPLFYVIINTFQFAITALLFVLIDKTAFRQDWERIRKQRGLVSQIIFGMILVYAVGVVAQYLLYVLGVTGTSQNEMQIANMFQKDPLNLVLLFLTLCVFTPIVEEVIYRKVLYGFLSAKFGTIAAIAGSGLVFGLMHVITQGDFIQAIPYVFMGSAFGYIYHRARQNLFVVMGVHFLNNLISYLGYLYLIIFAS